MRAYLKPKSPLLKQALSPTQDLRQPSSFTQALHWMGAPLCKEAATWLDAFSLLIKTFQRLVQPHCWRWHDISTAIVHTGIGSLPIVVVSTAVAGVVVTNEIAWHMDAALHTISMIPGFSGQFIFRELGVAIPALLLVAKVGAATTAEVGSMKVTEQIDALKLLGIDPITYLVFPRFIAALVSSVCLTIIAVSITLVCAIAVAVIQYQFSVAEFIIALQHFIGTRDILCALVKGVGCGGAIPIISCAYGFRCTGGAEGVGTATTNSVVASTIAVIILDFILTYVFTLIF